MQYKLDLKSNYKKYLTYFVFLINSVLASIAFTNFLVVFFNESGFTKPLVNTQKSIIFFGLIICFFLVFLICSIGGESQKAIEKFIQKISKHPLFTTVLIVAIFRLWYSSHFAYYTIYYDSGSYTDYSHNIFLGQTDIFRTPGYPYFLNFVHFISNNFTCDIGFHETVSLVQSILSLSSVVILYFAGRKLFSNRYILCLVSLFYGIAPCVFNWDFCTLTESLSLFCTVVLIYIIFSYLKNPQIYKAIVLGLYCFVLIMVRPTFVYLIAVIGVFFVARFIFCAKERKKAIAGILSIAMSGVLLLGYCGLNYKNYKYFSISSVNNTINNLFIVMYNGWYLNEDYPELSQYISDSITMGGEDSNWISDIIEVAPGYFSYKEIDSYVKDCISKHKSEFYSYTFDKAKDVLKLNVADQYTSILNEDFRDTSQAILKWTFPFTFASCFILVGIALILAIIAFIVKRRICWHVIGLCAIIFSHIAVSIYGSMGEFPRLCTMVVPAVIMLLFYLVDYFYTAIVKKKIFHLNNNNSTKIEIKNKTKFQGE